MSDLDTAEMEPPPSRLIYRQKELQQLLGLSRNAIERLMEAEGLPHPIKLSSRSKGWLAAEVHAWLDQRAAERIERERPERPCAL
ncbi:AlpA family transcriptional regulator [uncultured Parasphingopyxis sp.]|uniref:helix-turn-helix transcriptional regulator n=1 Tax=uncultured Parasphingopyxis sp. TaxID=1547918 RepID=UPI0026373FE4|nr:AlpA family phage regulatory protein [uncultured Parasphingopyxis sp.]